MPQKLTRFEEKLSKIRIGVKTLIFVTLVIYFCVGVFVFRAKKEEILKKVATPAFREIYRSAVALLPEKKEFPTVYKRWGDDKDCFRATLRGKPIACKKAMEEGKYFEEWIPYER